MGFPEVLTLVFVAAKLAGWIDWSWVWVVMPLIVEAVVVLLIGLVIFANRR